MEQLEDHLDEYVRAAGIAGDEKSRLFRKSWEDSTLTVNPMRHVDAYRMIRRRTAEAGFKFTLGCATGLTAHLEAGGTLENAQAAAAHQNP